MRRSVPLLATLALGASAALALTAGPALASTAAPASSAPRPLPYRVSAPYYESYDTSTDLATEAQQSGNKYLTLAFLQTAVTGSCTAYWNGDTATPIAPSTFGADIAEIQAHGGNVIPSFGGYSADTTSTELADSCTSVPAIAAVYESLVTTYHVPRIDLDVEGDSLTNTAGINRRNEAIALTEKWAAAHHTPVQFSYTIPVLPTGLTASGLAVLQNAVADHAVISTVNAMTFDYYIGTAQDMLADSESAASGVFTQLQALYPHTPAALLWHMIGITEMPGIDDYGPDETFTTANAVTWEHWATAHGLGLLSFWALQRDNGGCPGTQGASTCSGVTQPAWYFSHVFEQFTR
jgi:Glycosyl hydrolases family 18